MTQNPVESVWLYDDTDPTRVVLHVGVGAVTLDANQCRAVAADLLLWAAMFDQDEAAADDKRGA